MQVLVAAGIHNSPVGCVLTYVTTTTHKTLRGPRSRLDPLQEKHAQESQSQRLSGNSRWTADARHRRQGGLLCRSAMTPEYAASYGQAVVDNAKALADTPASEKWVAAGQRRNRQPPDVGGRDCRRPGWQESRSRLWMIVGITVNMNMIPFDTRRPMDPSGIRIGTPALTTRGMGADEMRQIGDWIYQALSNSDDSALHQSIQDSVKQLCDNFAVPAQAATVS